MQYFEEYRQLLNQSLSQLDMVVVETAAQWLREARDQGRQVFVCGNGGSAYTASHFATDLVKGASYGRKQRFRVLTLTDSLGTITAYANDVSFEVVFEEQLKNFAREGDLVVAISGSGNSANVLRAVETGRAMGCRTIGLTGRDGGKLASAVELNIRSPDTHMGRIEDAHMVVCHMLSYAFMDPSGAAEVLV